MSRNVKRDSAVGGALISGSGTLVGLSVIFGSAAMSPVAAVGAAIGVAACSAVFFYSVGVAIKAGKTPVANKDKDRDQGKSGGRAPSPRL